MSSELRCTQHIDGTITTGYDGKRALRMMFWGGAQHGQLASVLAHMRTAAGCIFGPFAHSWFTFIDRRELVFVRFGRSRTRSMGACPFAYALSMAGACPAPPCTTSS